MYTYTYIDINSLLNVQVLLDSFMRIEAILLEVCSVNQWLPYVSSFQLGQSNKWTVAWMTSVNNYCGFNGWNIFDATVLFIFTGQSTTMAKHKHLALVNLLRLTCSHKHTQTHIYLSTYIPGRGLSWSVAGKGYRIPARHRKRTATTIM